jgi:anti-sigma factor RsiW
VNEHPDVSELESLIGAYALDAVDPDERAAIDAHLAECPRCRAELADHLEVAAMLAHTGAPAPEGLWRRIAAALEEPPPALRLEVVDGARAPARRRRNRVRAILAAAAAIVIVAMGVQLVRQGNQIDDLHHAVAANDVTSAAMQALADPSSQKLTLSSPSGAKSSATAVITSGGAGFLMPSGLPPLAPDRTYQLWAIMPGKVISLGLLGADPGITAFSGKGAIKGLAVTDEVAGGVVQTSNAPVLEVHTA